MTTIVSGGLIGGVNAESVVFDPSNTSLTAKDTQESGEQNNALSNALAGTGSIAIYEYDDNNSATPTSGKATMDTDDVNTASILYINIIDSDKIDRSVFTNSIKINDDVYFQARDSASEYAIFRVTSPGVSIVGEVFHVPIELKIATVVAPADRQKMAVQKFFTDPVTNALLNVINKYPGVAEIGDTIVWDGSEFVADSRNPEVVLTANSLIDQTPTDINVPMLISYGLAQSTESIDIDEFGKSTVNEQGFYTFFPTLSIKRTTSVGAAIIFVRWKLNGVMQGVPFSLTISDDEQTIPLSFPFSDYFLAGDVIETEFVRDGAGTDNGSLHATTSSIGWGVAPSANLRVLKN